jgi:hypothetical protein
VICSIASLAGIPSNLSELTIRSSSECSTYAASSGTSTPSGGATTWRIGRSKALAKSKSRWS